MKVKLANYFCSRPLQTLRSFRTRFESNQSFKEFCSKGWVASTLKFKEILKLCGRIMLYSCNAYGQMWWNSAMINWLESKAMWATMTPNYLSWGGTCESCLAGDRWGKSYLGFLMDSKLHWWKRLRWSPLFLSNQWCFGPSNNFPWWVEYW